VTTLSWLELQQPVRYLKGIGPVRAVALAKVGVETIFDLLTYFPRSYQDRRQFSPIPFLKDGEVATIQGVVRACGETRPRPGLKLLKVVIADSKGLAEIIWFNQPYLKKEFVPGREVIVSGRVSRRFRTPQFNSPDWEMVDEDRDPLHSGRIVPIYPLTAGLTQRSFRSKMKEVVDSLTPSVPEFLPPSLLVEQSLLPWSEALQAIHFPLDDDSLRKARQRLAFEELFLLQLGFALRSRERKGKKGISFHTEGHLPDQFLQSLPYHLTEGQTLALEDLRKDLRVPRPMNRLLQGEVGSGKTVLAAWAMLTAVQSGYQAALMAPTEILAGQHFLVLQSFLEGLPVKVALLTSSRKGKERAEMLEALEAGSVQIAVGTHALLEEGVRFRHLGLVVIDEQHRFGVMQRKILREKGESPDCLVLTATPIPRSLALTLYGDLDVSTIQGLPANRQPVTTYLVAKARVGEVYQFIRREVQKGGQVYIVCPLVEGKEEEEERAAQAATKLFRDLQAHIFPELRLGLLHGRMSGSEKETAMADFRSGGIQVLVATTVIEVGVDVPNASLIVIWDADRFGLAQLHQLRGRVGRGERKSYCVLLASPRTEEARKRLEVLVSTRDGFTISAEDLKLRGPGEFFGTQQHGAFDLKLVNLFDAETYKMIDRARDAAFRLVQTPRLLQVYPLLGAMLARRFPMEADLAQVG
jgi:ATP-dependent DNA helicase RecG